MRAAVWGSGADPLGKNGPQECGEADQVLPVMVGQPDASVAGGLSAVGVEFVQQGVE